MFAHFLLVSSCLRLLVGQWVTSALPPSPSLLSADVSLPALGSSSFVDITNSWPGS